MSEINYNDDFKLSLANYKVKKIDVFSKLIEKIKNPKALELLEKSVEKYNEAVQLNSESNSHDAKMAQISSELFLYQALNFNYYEISLKPGASQYLILEEVEIMTEGGILLPPNIDNTKPFNEGIIIGIGECYIKNTDQGEILVKPMNKIGDKVRYRKGMEIVQDVTVNGRSKKCKTVDFTVVVGTIGNYFSEIGTSEPSASI